MIGGNEFVLTRAVEAIVSQVWKRDSGPTIELRGEHSVDESPLLQTLILWILQDPRQENPSCVIFCKIFRNRKKDNLLEAREGFRWLKPSACRLVWSSEFRKVSHQTKKFLFHSLNLLVVSVINFEIFAYCSECHTENEIKSRDPIRCRECGYRIMYKKRTKRSILLPTTCVSSNPAAGNSPFVLFFTCLYRYLRCA